MKKNIKEDIKNNTNHLLEYLLSNEFKRTLSKKEITIKKIFAPLFRFAYGFKSKYKFVLDSRESLRYKSLHENGRIFILNHRQTDDIVLSAKAIGKSGYFVFGNSTKKTLTNRYKLCGYGTILFNINNKKSQKSCYNKIKYVIKNGGNIIIFLDGHWNLKNNSQKGKYHNADYNNSGNWIIQDINIEILRLAQETGCEVVPTILHYDEEKSKKCYAKRGKPFTISLSDDIFEKKDEIITCINTMYYELMEKYSSYTRKELEQSNITLKQKLKIIKEELLNLRNTNFIEYKSNLKKKKEIEKKPVKHEVVSNEKAFSNLETIDYTKKDVYLLSKK